MAHFGWVLVFLIAVFCCRSAGGFAENYENNWYVILSSSKFYFNYRHSVSALRIYNYLRDNGIPDSRIILMLPENYACNARNPLPGRIYNDLGHENNEYCADIEVDYKNEDTSVENILNLFRGRHTPDVPLSKRLGKQRCVATPDAIVLFARFR